ncbi:C-terminal helicase domain-containing protein, partial [Ruegeria sp. NA]
QILSQDADALTLVFTRTKHGAERLMKGLVADGFNAASIHGNKSQGQRDRAINAFRAGEVNILVATDVAARGIDIPGVAY